MVKLLDCQTLHLCVLNNYPYLLSNRSTENFICTYTWPNNHGIKDWLVASNAFLRLHQLPHLHFCHPNKSQLGFICKYRRFCFNMCQYQIKITMRCYYCLRKRYSDLPLVGGYHNEQNVHVDGWNSSLHVMFRHVFYVNAVVLTKGIILLWSITFCSSQQART